MSVKITCINKDNGDHYDPYLSIANFGRIDEKTQKIGKSHLSEMIDWVEKGGLAYTRDSYGVVAKLVVRVSKYGNKYLQTVIDGRETNNLLSLKECL